MRKSLLFLVLLVGACTPFYSEKSDSVALQNESTKAINDEDGCRSLITDTDSLFHRLPNGIVLERQDSLYVWDDMVFNEEGLHYLCPELNRAGLYSLPSFYWPSGVVYYSYNASVTDTTYFRQAMNNISNSTSIVFKPRGNNYPRYVEFVMSTGNNSEVGMQQGGQIINIVSNNATTITHEILHALGFFHEQCRSDRDNYIIINWSNIRPEKAHNFQKKTQGIYDVYPFDYNSIMIYDSRITDPTFVYDTSINTMTKLDGTGFYSSSQMTTNDIASVAAIYGPPFHRLEKHESIVYESYSGYEDICITEESDSLVFYADRSCTIRQALSVPRYIRIEYYTTYVQDGRLTTDTTYETILVPTGTVSLPLWEGTNEVNQYMGEAQQSYYVTQLFITNYLVPSVYIY